MTEDYLTGYEVYKFQNKWEKRLGRDMPKGLRNMLYMNQHGRLNSAGRYRNACRALLDSYRVSDWRGMNKDHYR